LKTSNTAALFVGVYDSLCNNDNNTTTTTTKNNETSTTTTTTGKEQSDESTTQTIDAALARFERSFARPTGVRDLLKWCQRCVAHVGKTKTTTMMTTTTTTLLADDRRELVFREALDCFGGAMSEVCLFVVSGDCCC
jgi:hypothetical protein